MRARLADCPEDETELVFVANYSAPGIGWQGTCPTCSETFSVVDGVAYPPDEMVHIPNADFYR